MTYTLHTKGIKELEELKSEILLFTNSFTKKVQINNFKKLCQSLILLLGNANAIDDLSNKKESTFFEIFAEASNILEKGSLESMEEIGEVVTNAIDQARDIRKKLVKAVCAYPRKKTHR